MKNLVAEELKKNFLPELLNRLDREVILFKQLSKEQLREMIVEIRLKETYKRLKRQNI